MLATIEHAQFHDPGHFLAETNASCAMNATGHFLGGYQRADIFVKNHALFFTIARFTTAVAHREILQLAFAALVTDGAIQGMVDQQKFHDAFLRRNGLGRAGVHDHALRNRRCTCW